MENLETVSTDDLLAELQKRFMPLVFIGEPLANKERPTKLMTRVLHRGDYRMCLGMADMVKHFILTQRIRGDKIK